MSKAGTSKLIYVFYLLGMVLPLLSIIAVVMAYINEDDNEPWLSSHYQFQIRTFWIGLVFSLVGALLTMILIGYLILIFTAVWLIIRCVKGIKYLDAQQAHPEPQSWMFG